MAERSLRAVPSGESKPPLKRAPRKAAAKAPAKEKPKTLQQAVESNDYLEILKAQRRDIVEALPHEKGQAKATFHRQLIAISKEIKALEAEKEVHGEGGIVASTPNDAWDQSAI